MPIYKGVLGQLEDLMGECHMKRGFLWFSQEVVTGERAWAGGRGGKFLFGAMGTMDAS